MCPVSLKKDNGIVVLSYDDWPSHRISGMLHFLSLINHPLARYVVYRSLPTLIRTQKSNGLWFSTEDKDSPDDILIIMALRKIGILDSLLSES